MLQSQIDKDRDRFSILWENRVAESIFFLPFLAGRIDFLEDVPFLRSHVDRKGRKRKLSPRNENARL